MNSLEMQRDALMRAVWNLLTRPDDKAGFNAFQVLMRLTGMTANELRDTLERIPELAVDVRGLGPP